ncbi:expressed unknown protein [Seminavis robusta]|uniref:Gamma-glutamylcyclotransferase AIG2-like domain-containing protein n=1 Tax=Seminavis robusta TaxID=568900 RepID=A0A9N8E7S0_9STRA|nr:expressed unknown protein [Seminavis robusta]|eukprot:Sro635_g179170.1 n/a (132) ;mRNA; r:42213-42608
MRAQPATVAGAKLYLDSYPCLVFDDKNDDGTEPNNVKGWVFTADPLVFRAKIRHLNRVHGFQLDGAGLYQRTISTIKLDGPERSVGIPIGAKGDTLDAYIYHRPDCETDLRILSGDWLELPYTAGGEDEGF